MTPTRAWSPLNTRAFGSEIRNYGENITVLAALTTKGMNAVMSVNGSADAEVLVTYVEKILLPTLRRGQIVIMDNLKTHKDSRVEKLINSVGAKLIFLPSYSPDLSPIEEAFSKFKTILRRLGSRTRDELDEAISFAAGKITGKDAKGWFRHCGYDFYWL